MLQLPVEDSPQPPPGDSHPPLPSWIKEAKAELVAARKASPLAEPLTQPSTMSTRPYLGARKFADRWLHEATPDNVRFILLPKIPVTSDALELVPRSASCWRREALWPALDAANGKDLDAIVAEDDALRSLKEASLQKSLRARFPWRERKNLYSDFADITEDKRFWSLTHPFDDLDGTEMKLAIEVARKAKSDGLNRLDAEARQILLRAGAIDFFQHLLEASH
jgi:hypothetical protein